MKNVIIIFIAVVVISGCSVVNPKASFDEVAQTLSKRTGKKIIWNQGTKEDKEVSKAINELLTKELSVDEVVQISLLNSPKLQSMYENLGIAQADLVQAGLLNNPLFYASKRFPGKALEFDLLESFAEIFFIPLKKHLAGAELEAAKLKLTNEIINYIAMVKEAFFDLQSEMQLLEMEQSIVEATQASLDTTMRLYEAGNISLLEIQNEARFVTHAKLDVATTQGQIIQKREHLNVLIGLWGRKTDWKIVNRMPDLPERDPSGEGLESLAISKRGDILAAKQEIEVAMQGKNIGGLTAFLDGLAIGGHYEQEPDGLGTAGPDISIPLPLFDQGQAQFAKGNAILKQALMDYQQLAIMIRSEVRSAFSKMQVARSKADYYFKEVLPIQQRLIDQTQLRYNGMFVGIFDLLNAKQSQIETGKNYLETIKDYWLARTELEKVVGGEITEIALINETSLKLDIPIEKPTAKHMHHGEH